MMKKRRALFRLGAAIAVTACASTGPTIDGSSDSNLAGAKVEVRADGGIAPLTIIHRVDHDTRSFVFSQRRMCATSCPVPMDTTNGTLSAATTDSLFNVVLQSARALTKDDYGITRSGADMMTYTIQITADGRTRTVRGDDGTLPAPARQILAAVRETVSAAR